MKNNFYFLMIIIAIVLSCSKRDDNNITVKHTPAYRVDVVEIDAPSLQNSLIATDLIQKAQVFFPPNYLNNPNLRYPVVYFIHGFDESYATDYGIFKTAFDEMVAKRDSEFFIVTINSQNNLGGTFCVNSKVSGNWEDHIVKEVINFIDKKYRTISTKEARGIAGFSMGGFGCLYLGLRHADIYNLAYAISPGVFNETDLNSAFNIWSMEGGTFLSAYGAAFSPDASLSSPFAGIPLFNGTNRDNLIIENWKNGFGNFDQKINAYLSGNYRLKQIGVDYGMQDYYFWIPRGCDYLTGLFNNYNIPNEVHVSQIGTHRVDIDHIKSYMLPFFSKNLSFD